jgi:hypothetical protein
MLSKLNNDILQTCIDWKVNQVQLSNLIFSLGQMGFVENKGKLGRVFCQ